MCEAMQALEDYAQLPRLARLPQDLLRDHAPPPPMICALIQFINEDKRQGEQEEEKQRAVQG